MHVTQIAINRPITTLMFSLALIFLGVLSYRELPVQQFPDLSFPYMSYSVTMMDGSLSPEETNEEITRPFEKMVASLPGVKEMNSETIANTVIGFAKFSRRTDMRFRVIELQEKVNRWVNQKDERIAFVIEAVSTEAMSGALMELILSVPLGEEESVAGATDVITRKLKSIDGISRVEVSGEYLANIKLEVDREDLVAKGLSIDRLVQTINLHSEEKKWLGTLDEGSATHEIHMVSKVQTLDELMGVELDDAGIYRVGDVARPERIVQRGEEIFRTNGMRAVGITVSKESDRNTIQMARLVRSRIEDIQPELPAGFIITVLNDTAESLELMIRNLAKLAAAGAFLSMLVLLVFIRNWRVAMVVVVTIPASILMTFNVMYAANLSINLLSLIGLVAAVGMLVDNSIVVVENVFRYSKLEPDNKKAGWLGSREVTRALLISTATGMVVFVPLLFVEDEFTIIMKDMALSLVFPLACSLLIAMTLIPMLTSQVIGRGSQRRSGQPAKLPKWLERRLPWRRNGRPPRNYLKEFVFYFTKGALRHPVRLFFTLLLMILVTLLAAGTKIAIQAARPEVTSEQITLYGKPPLGSTLEESDLFFQEMEAEVGALMEQTDLIDSFTSRFRKNGGEVEININEKYYDLVEWEIQDALRSLPSGDDRGGFRFRPFPELSTQATAAERASSGDKSAAEQVLITGENIDAMLVGAEMAKKFLDENSAIEEAFIINPDGEEVVHYKPDLEMMRVLKADTRAIQTFFRSRDDRGVSTNLTLNEEGVERRVTVRALSSEVDDEGRQERQTLDDFRRMQIPLLEGGTASMNDLGSFSFGFGSPPITKTDRRRHIAVGFNFKSSFYRSSQEKERQDVLKELQGEFNQMRLPAGISAEMAGTLDAVDTQRETWKKLIWLAVIAVYLSMAFLFESVIAPIIILCTLPLALIGGVWGIIMFNMNLDAIAMLGAIFLVGLVVNNGILLVEYTRQMEREKGFRRPRALLAAVSYRLRPILMTSLTTILGLLPILFSSQAQRMAQSLVSVVVGGIITSSLLTLVVVPAFYNSLSIGMDKLIAFRRRKVEEFKQAFRNSTQSIFAPLRPTEEPPLEVTDLSISIHNVTKVYPLFTKDKLLHILPSRDYPFGHRPPTGNVAVKNVTLKLEGGMFGLLGPNGAGKTSLMKILTGLVEPTYGTIEIAGHDLREHRHGIRRLIGYLPQNFGVYGALTLDQYLSFFAPHYGLNDLEERRRKFDEVAEMVGLGDVRHKPMKTFSGGMRQRAGIAQLLLKPRPILIVDEPTAGLDPVERVRFRLLLSELARTRIVILSTHIVDDVTSSCRRVAVLNRGEVIYEGDLEQIRERAYNMIWDVTRPSFENVPIPKRHVLYKKHVGDQILYHYYSDDPLPGSTSSPANFEDAYVALLLRHDARQQITTSSDTPSGEHQGGGFTSLGESPEFSS